MKNNKHSFFKPTDFPLSLTRMCFFILFFCLSQNGWAQVDPLDAGEIDRDILPEYRAFSPIKTEEIAMVVQKLPPEKTACTKLLGDVYSIDDNNTYSISKLNLSQYFDVVLAGKLLNLLINPEFKKAIMCIQKPALLLEKSYFDLESFHKHFPKKSKKIKADFETGKDKIGDELTSIEKDSYTNDARDKKKTEAKKKIVDLITKEIDGQIFHTQAIHSQQTVSGSSNCLPSLTRTNQFPTIEGAAQNAVAVLNPDPPQSSRPTKSDIGNFAKYLLESLINCPSFFGERILVDMSHLIANQPNELRLFYETAGILSPQHASENTAEFIAYAKKRKESKRAHLLSFAATFKAQDKKDSVSDCGENAFRNIFRFAGVGKDSTEFFQNLRVEPFFSKYPDLVSTSEIAGQRSEWYELISNRPGVRYKFRKDTTFADEKPTINLITGFTNYINLFDDIYKLSAQDSNFKGKLLSEKFNIVCKKLGFTRCSVSASQTIKRSPELIDLASVEANIETPASGDTSDSDLLFTRYQLVDLEFEKDDHSKIRWRLRPGHSYVYYPEEQ